MSERAVRRPFKVRAWSMERMDWVGGSFASRGPAEAKARAYQAEGLHDIRVWEVDARGYVVEGSYHRLREYLPE